VSRFADWPWNEEEKKAALEALRMRRTDIEAQTQDESKTANLQALDEVIAELEQETAAERPPS
jgi:hypothetical protein